MEPETIVLSQVTQSQKDKYQVFFLICILDFNISERIYT